MEKYALASREIMWNISHSWIMYALLAVSLAVFGYGIIRRIGKWRRGKPDTERFSNPARRMWYAVGQVTSQRKLWKSAFPGVFHAMFFYPFFVLYFTTVVIGFDYDFGIALFDGYLYSFLTIAADLAGFSILAGIGLALWRRCLFKPKTLRTEPSDLLLLLLLAFIVVSGFLVEGVRIAVAGDYWSLLSPVGYILHFFFQGLSPESGATLHIVLWWLHTSCVFVWIAIIPFSKFFHIFLLPANIYFSKMKPAGELSRIDLDELMDSEDFDEENFNIGIETTGDLTWKHRLDLDSCISCGRCEEVCPPFSADQPLSPKKFVSGIKDLVCRSETAWKENKEKSAFFKEIVGAAFEEEFVWRCRTCMACVESCPAFVEHVDTLVEIRRHEVSMKGRMPEEVAATLRIMENYGNPFSPQVDRADWVAGLEIPIVESGGECDVLYWIGCLATFDQTKQETATDMIRILKHCSIDFGILGPDENCCADPARTMGEENLFQVLAKQQVEELKKRRFKTILVTCPHCYNVLKNEYPQFNGHFNVVHSSDFLLQMINEKKLVPKQGENGP